MTQQEELSVPFDPIDPFPWYRQMRDTAPVFFNPTTSAWMVFRYDDVLRVLNTPTIFSSNISTIMPGDTPFLSSIIFMDPPRHRRIRSLTNAVFSPRQLALLEPRITAIVNDLLDQVISQGEMDIVTDLSYPLPMIVIAEMLGVDQKDREDFIRWSEIAVSFASKGLQPVEMTEMDTYFRRLIAERQQNPKDDIISMLVHAQIDGEQLEAEEILGFSEVLLVAGYEATASLLVNTFRVFDEYPQVMEEMWADASIIPSLIEESLRYRSPTTLQMRLAAVDTELHGQQIKAGQFVFPMLGSANRDERQFAEPDRFDVHRTPNKHVSFGLGGIHFCLGAPLARMEARIALSLIRERLYDIRRDRSVALKPISEIANVSAVQHFPITFQAR